MKEEQPEQQVETMDVNFNGIILKGIPKTATQEQIMRFVEDQSLMSREELLMYTDEQDLKDVVEFYKKVDLAPSLGNPIADVFTKDLAKFAYAGYKEPRTLARALPDITSGVGATGAAGLAAMTGVGTVPALALMSLGSAFGYLAGTELEEEITGVEYDSFSKTTDAAEAGITDLLIGATPSVVRRGGQLVQSLRGKGGAQVTKFESEAQREMAQVMAKKLQEQDAGLLTIQVGNPTSIGGLLFDVGRASVTGKREIRAALEGQSEYLRTNIDSVLNQYGDRMTSQELGETILKTVEGQKKLSNDAFEGLFDNALGNSADTMVNTTPFKNQVVGFINASKKNNQFYERFQNAQGKLKNAEAKVLSDRRTLNDLKIQLEDIDDPEARAQVKKSIESYTNRIESSRIDASEAKVELNALEEQSKDAFEDSTLLSKYEDLLRMDDNMTNRELTAKLRAIRGEISEIRTDSPAKTQKPMFSKLVDAQDRLEKLLTSNLEGEDLVNFKAVDELYKNNAKLLRGEAITKILSRQESAETIASLFTDTNRTSYFDTFNKVINDTPRILRKAGVDEDEIKAFVANGAKVKNAVVRKYLELNLAERIKGQASDIVETQDSFKVISDFIGSLGKRGSGGKGADKFDQMMNVSTKGKDSVLSIIDDYKFLVRNLPAADQGRFTLAVVGQQSAGLSQATSGMAEAPSALAGGDIGFLVKILSGISKMLAPERVAHFVTNPEEAVKLANLSKAARKMIETGKTNQAIIVALGSSYNRMLQSIQEETTAQSALSSYFGEEFTFPEKKPEPTQGALNLPRGALFGM